MKKRVVGIAGALLLALLGTVLLVAFVRNAEERAVADEEVVDVLVVTDPVEAGTAASEIESSLTTEQVPAKVRADGAIEDVSGLDEVEDLVAAVDLLPGEQLVRSRFVEAGGLRRASVPVPDGLLEVTVEVEPQRTLGGLLKAGDSVAVLASFDPFTIDYAPMGGQDLSRFTAPGEPPPVPVVIDGTEVVALPEPVDTPNVTRLMLNSILVTRVQADDSDPEIDPDDESTGVAPSQELLVTMAMDAESAERLVFTQEFGRVWLALQPSGADTEGAPGGITRGSIFQVQ